MERYLADGESHCRSLLGKEQPSVNGVSMRDRRPEEESIKLTKREIEVLTLVIEGRSSKEVADMLYVSKRTVDFHLANIYEKLQVSNRVQAFRRAARLGLIPFDPQFAEAQ
jgi:DNA-binding CsgD family transcriptional regulator